MLDATTGRFAENMKRCPWTDGVDGLQSQNRGAEATGKVNRLAAALCLSNRKMAVGRSCDPFLVGVHGMMPSKNGCS